MSLTAEFSELVTSLGQIETARPWRDERIKIGETYVGMPSALDSSFVAFCYQYKDALLEGLKLRDKFPKAENCALLSRATLLYASRKENAAVLQ